VVFAGLLLYGSGGPVYLAFFLQQIGRLPSGPLAAKLFFPFAVGSVPTREDGQMDLIHQDYLMITLPWFLASVCWEALMVTTILPPEKRPMHIYRWNDTISSVSLGLLNVLVNKVVILKWGRALYSSIYTNWRLTDAFSDIYSPAAWWFAFLVGDFFYYVYHRASHYISWVWAGHVVHHSSEEYNLSTALRQPSNDWMTPSLFIYSIPLAFFVPPELDVIQAQIGLLYQFWIHTQLIPPLPKLELIFNSAALHRIHHSRNLRALGKNYGSVLIIWDRLFGTFEPEVVPGDSEPLFYGVIPPLNSWNPLWANLHHFHHMFVAQRRWHGWLTPFVHWTPPNGRCPKLGSRLNPYDKYNARASSVLLRNYLIGQFVLTAMLGIGIGFTGMEWAREQSGHLGIFLFAFLSLSCVGSLQGAETVVALQRMLMVESGRQVLICVAALVVMAVGELQSSTWTIALGMSIALLYGLVHAACLVPMLRGALRLRAAESATCQGGS